ncbi:MAG: Crp/Fnr family transcriptional regulator [Burkholderiaceae bacterium]
MTDAWIDRFPGLDQPALARLRDAGELITLAAGSRVFGPGSAPRHFLLLLEGSIRVQQVSEGGREIVLYRVSAGESCALTTACLMAYEDYQAEAIVEEPSRAVAIPRALFDELIAQSAGFRRFVFTAFSKRVTELFRVIAEVAFERIDIRLAHRLLDLAGEGDTLAITHQQLASELGSAREVISRQLAEFQRRGWLEASRGALRFRDKPALRTLADAR